MASIDPQPACTLLEFNAGDFLCRAKTVVYHDGEVNVVEELKQRIENVCYSCTPGCYFKRLLA